MCVITGDCEDYSTFTAVRLEVFPIKTLFRLLTEFSNGRKDEYDSFPNLILVLNFYFASCNGDNATLMFSECVCVYMKIKNINYRRSCYLFLAMHGQNFKAFFPVCPTSQYNTYSLCYTDMISALISIAACCYSAIFFVFPCYFAFFF
jgi:hypothetical protein